MGNILSAQVNDLKQTAVNGLYQESEQTCTASCENIQSGNTIFLDGTTTGDIIFKQRCEANATCMMDNSVSSIMAILQDLKQGNTTEANLFGGGINFGSVNLNLSEQEIETQVRQILGSVCSVDTTNIQNNNMVYARNSNTGDIIFEQEGNALANCVMVNAASAQLNLQQKGDQTNTTTAGGVGGIIAFIVIAIVILVVVSIVGKVSKSTGETGGARPPPVPPRPTARRNF